MPNDKNIWSKAFNDSKLDNESWLEPSSDVLANVKKEIYGEKKKRRPFFLFLLPFILLGGMGIAYLFLRSNNSISIENKTISQFQQSKLDGHSDARLVDHSLESTIVHSKEAKKDNFTINESQHSNILKSPSASSSSTATPVKSKRPSLQDSKKGSGKPPLSFEHNVVSTPYESIDANNISIADSSNIATDFIDQLPKLLTNAPRIPTRDFDIRYNRDVTFLDNDINPTQVLKKTYLNRIHFSLAYTNAVFALNKNYRTALNQADYQQKQGNGFHFNFGYKRSFSNRILFGTDLTMERIQVKSGHNTEVIYKLENEIDGQHNSLPITVASPLGFTQSNVVLQRNALIPGSEENVLLDLQSTHTFYAFSFQPYIDFKIYNKAGVAIGINSGIGINYVKGVQNSLTANPLETRKYSPLSAEINENQTFVQHFTPFAAVGIEAQKSISNTIMIGISYRFSNTLSPLYQNGDFSSNLIRNQLSAFVAKKF